MSTKKTNDGKHMDELEDPEYCPNSKSHKHSFVLDGETNAPMCEYCGVIES